jgi:uncharacterized short protein YbdD (DUF466 family)
MGMGSGTLSLGEWVALRVRSVRWYVTTLMGDRAYDTYVAHLAARHPGAPPLSERAFWVGRYREQEQNPGARCC